MIVLCSAVALLTVAAVVLAVLAFTTVRSATIENCEQIAFVKEGLEQAIAESRSLGGSNKTRSPAERARVTKFYNDALSHLKPSKCDGRIVSGTRLEPTHATPRAAPKKHASTGSTASGATASVQRTTPATLSVSAPGLSPVTAPPAAGRQRARAPSTSHERAPSRSTTPTGTTPVTGTTPAASVPASAPTAIPSTTPTVTSTTIVTTPAPAPTTPEPTPAPAPEPAKERGPLGVCIEALGLHVLC